MIQARNLTKIYGKTEAIRDVSFHVEKGEILGFLGPNGAGKTTTMRILTGHTPPTRGTALVAGYDVLKQSLNVRKRIGYMPEMFGLYEDMTVRPYLEFIAEAKGLNRSRRHRRIPEVLEQTGLQEIPKRLIRNLSKGYRQRLGLAQALVADPDVLILDEPTVGLDPAQIREIRSLIKSMEGAKTIILSTHILPEVAVVCSRIAIINLGRIAAVGSPEELAGQISPGRRLALLTKAKKDLVLSTLKRIPGVQNVKESSHGEKPGYHLFHIDVEKDKDLRSDISAALHKAGCELYELYSVGVSLEEVYMKVVMGET